MIVLVTGSRDWPRNQMHFIWAALNHELLASIKAGKPMELWHGACPAGADAWAHEWYAQIRIGMYRQWISERPFPADWPAPCTEQCKPGHRKSMRVDGQWISGCPRQGPVRNHLMVKKLRSARDAGTPAVCLAFIRDQSPGATGCRKAAKDAHLRTATWTMKGGEVYSHQT